MGVYHSQNTVDYMEVVNIEDLNDLKIKKRIGNYLMWFQTFKKSNLVTYIHIKTSNSILLNWVYFVLPIIFYSVIILITIKDKVFWNSNIKLSFINDLSNSLGMSVLYFISYFLSQYYPNKFYTWLEVSVDKEYYKKISEIHKNKSNNKLVLFLIGLVLLIIGIGAGYSFYSAAITNGNEIWTYYLSDLGKIYYCIFLGVTWYHSLSLLGMALFSGFTIYWCIMDNALIYNPNYYNKNQSIIKAVDILLSTFSYGLFYIIGSILFILNDKIAATKNIYNTFSNDIAAFILVLSVLLLTVITYIPLHKLINFMNIQKEKRIVDLNIQISQSESQNEKDKLMSIRDNIIQQNPIITSLSNKLFLLLSVLIPLLGVIFQAVELLNK